MVIRRKYEKKNEETCGKFEEIEPYPEFEESNRVVGLRIIRSPLPPYLWEFRPVLLYRGRGTWEKYEET